MVVAVGRRRSAPASPRARIGAQSASHSAAASAPKAAGRANFGHHSRKSVGRRSSAPGRRRSAAARRTPSAVSTSGGGLGVQRAPGRRWRRRRAAPRPAPSLDQAGVEVVAQVLQHRQARGGVGGDDLRRREALVAQVAGGGDEGVDPAGGQPRQRRCSPAPARSAGVASGRAGRALQRRRLVHEDQAGARRADAAARSGASRRRRSAARAAPSPRPAAARNARLQRLALRTQVRRPSQAPCGVSRAAARPSPSMRDLYIESVRRQAARQPLRPFDHRRALVQRLVQADLIGLVGRPAGRGRSGRPCSRGPRRTAPG